MYMARPEVRVKPEPPLPPRSRFHRLRKGIHALCFAVFVVLPFFNLLRFDIPRQRFYFAGQELWINEFGIIFFSLMFLMFLIAASAILYGRVYCSYLCPQMIFSEVSLHVEQRLKRIVNRKLFEWPPKTRALLWRGLFLLILGVASVFLAFIFIAYFVEPRDLLRRLLALDIQTAGGIAGASVTLLTFLDFTFIRQHFCTTVCPYGYLQGMLGDGDTLLVHYRDQNHECIECKKCVRICHMGIDIRTSPFQLECIHCGECIDACEDVLGRLHKPGLIHYAWGEKGEATDSPAPWHRRIGFRDPKRFVILLVIAFYFSGLMVALSMRRPVLIRISPVRATLYRAGADGVIYNRFRMTTANRSPSSAFVAVSIEGLPAARLVLEQNPLPLSAGEASEQEFEIAMRPFSGAREVNHFMIAARTAPGDAVDRFPMTFLMPMEDKAR